MLSLQLDPAARECAATEEGLSAVMDLLFADLQARDARECFGLARAADTSTQQDPAAHAELAQQVESARQHRAESERLAREVVKLKRALEERDQLVRDRNKTVETLQDEVHLANLELSQADRQIAGLKEENEMLVQRWIERVNLEADRG